MQMQISDLTHVYMHDEPGGISNSTSMPVLSLANRKHFDHRTITMWFGTMRSASANRIVLLFLSKFQDVLDTVVRQARVLSILQG